MNLSASFLLALLFLAPGFAGYFGLSSAVRGRSVPLPPPAPNSLTFLVGVALCALVAHVAAMALFTAQDLYCLRHACYPAGFVADPYATLWASLNAPAAAVRSSTILLELLALLGLCGVTYFAARWATRVDLGRGPRSFVLGFSYRWLAPYAKDVQDGNAVTTAYVLTKMRHEDLALGYRGVIVDLGLMADGQIGWITLSVAERFGLRLSSAGDGRPRTIPLGNLLAMVHIPGREIDNLVFTTLRFPKTDPS